MDVYGMIIYYEDNINPGELWKILDDKVNNQNYLDRWE